MLMSMKRAAVAAALAIAATASAFAENPRLVIETSAGKFTVELFADKAPETVKNFVGLAMGEKEYTDPTDGQKKKGPYFNGTPFHRTVSGFMIQGGDPTGTGMGGPGYKFKNEDSDLTFDKPYLLAMANAGRDTNGSQFFVTLAPKSYLNGNYTIFGRVVSGTETVDKIGNAPVERSASGEMSKPVKLEKIVSIISEGKAGEAKLAPADAPNPTPAQSAAK